MLIKYFKGKEVVVKMRDNCGATDAVIDVGSTTSVSSTTKSGSAIETDNEDGLTVGKIVNIALR